ncbi:MAG: maleylpyruvate isomerase family mycothiol-dependent enzyme [Sporichthyaceae bacterium]
MEQITAALAAQHAELAKLIAELDADAWRLESRCRGWSVSDVLLHLAQTEELALASLQNRLPTALDDAGWGTLHPDVDSAADAAVRAQRGAEPADVQARWTAAARASMAGFGAVDPKARVQWVAGQLSAPTLATTRLAEAWIHSGDIAHALGVKLEPTDRLWHIARLAWRTLPYALKKAGQTLVAGVTLELIAPDGSLWVFSEEEGRSLTTIRGPAELFCEIAARRIPGDQAGLEAYGPDRYAVLDLVRTFA